MKESSHKRYPADGESPAHGSVTEYTRTWDRDDIMEEICQALLEYSSYFELNDEQIDITEYITEADMENIQRDIEEKLLDDDFGSGKDYDLVISHLDDLLDKDADYEVDIQEFR